MRVFFAVLFASTAAICYGYGISEYSPLKLDDSVVEVLRLRREISDECRPPPPPHHHHHHHPHRSEEGKIPPMCCELPTVIPIQPEVWSKCQEIVPGPPPPPPRNKRELRRSNGGHSKRVSDDKNDDDAHQGPPSPSPSPQSFQERKECFLNCFFNGSGFLSNDGMLNEETLNQKLLEETANDTKWASTIDPVFRKCVAAAKEANSQSQKTCKPGAAEYMKCMTRELFFNCPSDIWVNSSECNEFKNKLEKCPNLSPPPFPHHPHRAQTEEKKQR